MRTLYASRTLADEITATFGDAVTIQHVGDPDGWGLVRGLQVAGRPEDTAVVAAVAGRDSRVQRVVEVGDVVLVQFRPRADGTAPFGVGSVARAR